MTQLSNPFLKKSKFQYLYYSTPSYFSSQSLLGPQTSICPKKKYSKNDWYEYKSSQHQLSEKILYRMNAQYYKLQSMNNRDEELYSHRNCLLNTQLRKNPFHKGSLLHQDMFNTVRNYKTEKDWTEQQGKAKFRDPFTQKNYTQQVKQYGQLKKKVQSMKLQKVESNNSLFGMKGTNKLTFGLGLQQKFAQNNSINRKQTDSWRKTDSNRGSKQFLGNLKVTQSLNNFDDKQIKLNRNQSSPRIRVLKQSSSDTFTLKKESTAKQAIPQKIKYKNVTYHLVSS